MASAMEKVIEIAANNLFDNASVQSCLTAVTDLSNNLDARVNAGVSSVIDSAPGALDTLNELAAALGDDANYAATTAATIAANTSAIATKYQAGNDVSFNDLSANDISGVNFFTTGGSFIGDLLGNATTATSATSATSATTAGTVTGNTQTAITSIGTLTSLVVSGDISGNDASFNVVDIHTLNLTTNLNKSKVGLGDVDNTTDAGKPVSTAQQTALDLKANVAGPTFTGKVTTSDLSGNDASFNVVDIHTLNLTTNLNKSDVGLGNVDNTTDAGKPVSTAQQTALDLKANVAGPTFTGNVTMSDLSGNDASFNVVDIHTLNLTTALSASGVGLGNVDNTTDAGKPVSTAQQTALDLKANLAGPTFTGKVTMGDLSGNDASFNVVDLASLKVNGVSITQNGSGGASLNINSDISINDIHAQDASFNTLRTSGTMSMGGHILPTTNAAYDIGSAEYKIRHLFLSDNSLWIGDNHKIDISGGKMKFKKRKNDKVPTAVTNASGNETAALAHAGVGSLADMTLDKWQKYAATLSGAPGIKEMFGNDQPAEFDTDRDLLDSTVLPVKTDGGPPVTTPVVGTMTFNSSDKKLYIYDGTIWKSYSADS
jgi:hypothetical protein